MILHALAKAKRAGGAVELVHLDFPAFLAHASLQYLLLALNVV